MIGELFFRFVSKSFQIFRNIFVRFVLSKIFQKIGRAETIRLVRKSSKSELSSRFFGRLKLFIGQGSLYCLEMGGQFGAVAAVRWPLPLPNGHT